MFGFFKQPQASKKFRVILSSSKGGYSPIHIEHRVLQDDDNFTIDFTKQNNLWYSQVEVDTIRIVISSKIDFEIIRLVNNDTHEYADLILD